MSLLLVVLVVDTLSNVIAARSEVDTLSNVFAAHSEVDTLSNVFVARSVRSRYFVQCLCCS